MVGYCHADGYFKFKNSWSKNWGDNGYGYLSYDYMESYCLDAWSATDLIAPVDPGPAARRSGPGEGRP